MYGRRDHGEFETLPSLRFSTREFYTYSNMVEAGGDDLKKHLSTRK